MSKEKTFYKIKIGGRVYYSVEEPSFTGCGMTFIRPIAGNTGSLKVVAKAMVCSGNFTCLEKPITRYNQNFYEGLCQLSSREDS